MLCAPGNVGIGADARLLDVAADDVDGIVAAARAEAVDLVVVGPEVPLVAGVCDALAAAGIVAFGPSGAAARLEGSKAYAKEVMAAAGVPTAAHRMVDTVADGMDAIGGRYPAVIKADGLAAGKGVVIAEDAEQATAALQAMLVERRFGDAPVLVEEFLGGEELSLLALCDGVRAIPMAPAQDYKRIFDGDVGPNTGGMGSYSPVVGIDPARAAQIAADVHQPVVDLLRDRGTPFHGVLYAGIMLTADGPRVLEFNTRFGDPETQAVLPRLRSDLVEVLLGRHPDRRAGGRRAGVGRPLGGDAGARERRLSGHVVERRRHPWPRRRSRRRRGHPRGDGRGGRGDRHRGRTRPERHRARCRAGRRARCRVCCRRHDRVRRTTAAPRHRPAGRGADRMTGGRERSPSGSPRPRPRRRWG